MEPDETERGRVRAVRGIAIRVVVALAVVLAGLGLLPDRAYRTEEFLRTERAPLDVVAAARLDEAAPDLAEAARIVQPDAVRRQRAAGPRPDDLGRISATESTPPTVTVVAPPAEGVPVGEAPPTEGEVPAVVAEPVPPGEPGATPEQPANAGVEALVTPEEAESELPESPAERAAEALAPERIIGGDLDAPTYTAIGVTFESRPSGPVFIRVRDELGWSDWYELDAYPGEGPDPGTEGNGTVSTAPVWTGTADAYLVSLPADALTDGPEVATVHRDTRTVAVDPVEEAGAAEFPVPGGTGAQPRSSWGARAPRNPISTASSIRFAVVHHTVNSNAYSAADVPGILRAIQAFHMDANGWDDIGYNFLVDRFGRIWEGRARSLDSAAIGAHVAGFNTGSVGIANIGTFEQSGPTAAQVTATAEIAARRLAAYGVDASSAVNVTAGAGADKFAPGTTIAIPRVVGHRDIGATSCPGILLWGQLGSIRTAVAARVRELSAPFGNLELWAAAPGQLRISGWALDPQSAGPVVIYVESGPYQFSTLANLPRPDVGAVFGLGADRGFNATFAVPPGRYRTCVYAIDPQNGAGTVLRCGEILTGGNPVGDLISTSVTGRTLRVEGWAIDPDFLGPIAVLVDAGGRLQLVLADRRRDGLGAFFPAYGSDHGFVAEAQLPPGTARVCAYGINLGAGSDAALGCRSVVVK